MTLTEFLAARLDEDEANARRFILATTVPPDHEMTRHGMLFLSDLMQARILREVEAKRAFLDLCARVISDDDGHDYYSDGWAGLGVAKLVLGGMATVYSDHPDYDPEWKP